MNLPCTKCKGQCCQNLAIPREEFDFLSSKYGKPAPEKYEDFGVAYIYLKGRCAFLGENKCSVYEDRPQLCRDYGENIPCNY